VIPPRAESLKNDLTRALAKELEIARRMSQGDRSNEAINGQFVKQQAGGYVYEFENLTGFPPDEGVQISFTVGTTSSKGKYLGEVNSKFLFELENDLGERISRVTVVSDPLFLLEKQIETLSKEGPFENLVALASVGFAEYPDAKSISPDKKYMEGLNSLQGETLEVASKNSVTYIWGPPGTGKTTTMGSVVAALADSGLKVLLVSNTNLALDTALERCLERYVDYSGLEDGFMLRIGTMVKPELVENFGSSIELDVIYAREVKELQEEISKLSLELGVVRNDLSDLNDLRRAFDKAKLDASSISNSKSQISQLERDVATSRETLANVENKIRSLESEFQSVSKKGGMSRLLSGSRNPDVVRRDLVKTQSDKEKSETSILAKKREIAQIQASEKDAERKVFDANAWLRINSDAEVKIQAIPKLEQSSSRLQDQIEVINKAMQNKRGQIISRARVVACTAFKTILDADLSGLKFDVVVVDEASMLPLPLYYCAASLATDRIVIAGDFRQLPPIVRLGSFGGSNQSSDDQMLKELMSANPFTKSGVIVRGSESKQLVALRDQYRMRQPISDLISTNFYPEHTLRTVNEKLDKPTPWGNDAFIFVDTASLEPESSTVNGKSRRNVEHALVAKAMVEELYRDGWQFDSTAEKSFAVITPYAKQSSFIENLVSSAGDINAKGGISTVHRFQGNERDLIIIDLTKVSSPSEPGLGDFLGNPDPLASANAMWNVAISRARQHVVVIGHMPTLQQNSGALISHLVNAMKANMTVVDASTLLDKEAREFPAPTSGKGSISWFTGQGFYEAFNRDLAATKSKLFLASPFSTSQGTDRWIPVLRSLSDANVELICLTKPVSEKANFEEAKGIHNQLEDIFKELRTVPKMHEKIAVIDGRIVWVGSLNILSHKNASEIMMRIESPDFAKSITDEYLFQRSTGSRPPRVKSDGTAIKEGDSCDSPGCHGEMILRPAGVSKNSGRPYAAFLSCNQFPRCKNSVNF
jgi:superfamily I DNA and/or RNA helicase